MGHFTAEYRSNVTVRCLIVIVTALSTNIETSLDDHEETHEAALKELN